MLERKIRRYQLIDTHRKLVQQGKFAEASLLLEFLRKGKVTLYLDDVSCAVEFICENAGCHISYSRNGNRATAYL